MPRRPSGHRLSLAPYPLTFTPFSRSIVRLASAYMVKRKMNNAVVQRRSSSPFGNKATKHASKKSEETDSSDEEKSEGVVQADFAFFDPKPNDFHGVKVLLQTYLDDKEWDLSGFVDLILEQTTVGTVVKIEGSEDEGLFAVITALNLKRYKGHKCIKELKDFLLQACPKNGVLDNLRLLLGDKSQDVGLLVSQRVFNLPLPLLPPLYGALFDEVSWATEDELTKELQDSFRFKYYLLVSKLYKHKDAGKKGRSVGEDEENIIYLKPEDEIFHKLSSWSFEFPLHSQPVAANELKNYRLMGLAMAVTAEKISTFKQELQSLVDDSTSNES